MNIAIANTGGWTSFLGIMSELMFATNRLRQMSQRNVVCRKTSRPSDPNGKEDSARKAKSLQIGRLLTKGEQTPPAEKSWASQRAAFTTSRQITTNEEPKSIMRDWKAGGSTSYREGKAGSIVALFAETVGAETGRRQRKQWGKGHTIRIQEGSSDTTIS